MKWQLLTFMVLAQLGGTLAACANIEVKTGCFSDSDCFAGSVCIEGACVTPDDFECGNQRLEPGETCDGNCVTVCDDRDACTQDALIGSDATCDARCSFDRIAACETGDGCCPAGCQEDTDADCEPTPPCENEALDGDETDVDCGGSCGSCDDGRTCKAGSDCASNQCEDNVCIGPNVCVVQGSKHATIQSAIDDLTCQVIRLKPGRYAEHLQIGRALEIAGAATEETTIDGSNTGRVMDISAVGSDGGVTIRNLDIVGGRAGQGAGIRSLRDLRLESVTLRSNIATGSEDEGSILAYGGAIYADGINLTILNSTIDSSSAETPFPGRHNVAIASGGAIYAIGSTLIIEDANFTNNQARVPIGPYAVAYAEGGGIYADETPMSIARSVFSRSRASAFCGGDDTSCSRAVGGAIRVFGFTTIIDAVFTSNQAVSEANSGRAQAYGGAIFAVGNSLLEVRRSSVSDNLASATAPRADAEGGGVHAFFSSSLVDSLIAANKVVASSGLSQSHSAWGQGGGLVGANGGAIINTTISHNQVQRFGGVVTRTSRGGGIYGHPSIVSSTIVHNSAEEGGGIFSSVFVPALFKHNILANNEAEDGPDCAIASLDPFGSDGFNLIGTVNGCDAAIQATDLIGQDPLLDPLADNGGPTRTHLPAEGSPVIDGGDPAGCTDEGDNPLTIDQRVEPRIGACDIGAVEVQ